MPLFEYLCRKCRKKTEFIEKAGSRAKHSCSHCGSTRMEKQLSTFGVGVGGKIRSGKSCSGCSKGSHHGKCSCGSCSR